MDKEFGYEDESKKKFQIKRWMVIVAALLGFDNCSCISYSSYYKK